ncbi:OLC1v1021367C2 [Oldenlandia corymbosa var. corymbosa]|uniref:OLC1v1021367C2 n=1 Tax=Oldenlandia corymbosa var. corymbosa TaxID=529605 RepID=A0AAV1BVR4_OLDCO|nr:OLC1v1021367C2 [Oldenlandia corymbosa var. corymbosa]
MSASFTLILLLLLLSTTNFKAAASSNPGNGIICYKSIISFGDSLADTGNLLRLSSSNKPPPHFFRPPYGESYFHHPTGRCSDGRLVVDFIAESLDLPLLPPYLAGKDAVYHSLDDFKGVNFAVAGATALDDSFFREKGIHNPFTNISLGIQLGWFKDMLHSLCQINSSGCQEMARSSLFLVGEIGGNDYNHPLLLGLDIEATRSFVTPVIRTIGSAIEELIELGAVTLVVPGNFPIGCSAAYLTQFRSPNPEDYDTAGCLKWLNNFSKYHNKMLQLELNRIRQLHPHTTIIYADYYNAAMRMYRFPQKYGFARTLSACCGGGGAYNYNPSVVCGNSNETSTSCDDPSRNICWDGLHLTEAAYRWIAQGILQGPFSVPPLNGLSCTTTSDEKLVQQN